MSRRTILPSRTVKANSVMAGVASGTTLVRWIRPAYLVGTGLALAAAGFAVLTRLHGGSGIADLLVGVGILQFGMGIALPLAVNLVIATAPSEEAGAAAAMNETGSEFGGALGIAVLGTAAASAYRTRMADTIPSGLPDDVAATARETLGGASAAASKLPAEAAGPLLDAARDAFAHGFSTAATLGALVLGVTALLAGYLLRALPREAGREASHA